METPTSHEPQHLNPENTDRSSLNDIVLTEEIVYSKLTKLKNKYSLTPDAIPPLVYKRLSLVLCLSSIIFTRSFEDSRVLTYFSNSIVTPVYKNKGSISDPKNYRLIA